MVDILAGDVLSSLPPDARGPLLASPASCGSYIGTDEIHSGSEPWLAEGVSRATWYRRSRPTPATEPRAAERFRWYVVRTYRGQTDRAEEQIREAGFEVVTAKLCHPATRARRSASGSLIRAREEWFGPLFVPYIIVRLNLADPAWHQIRDDIEGVERIISGSHLTNNGVGIPMSIPDKEIVELRKLLSPAGVLFPPGYRAPIDDDEEIPTGTALRLKDGLLADRAAICQASNGKRVLMMMGWFNRDTVPVHVAQVSVETV